jgi:acetyltransferase-like isoleucine patch superfamily enzyme
MNLIGLCEKLYSRYRIWRARRAGLTMAEDCSITGLPFFGSEPYLITIGKQVGIADGVSFITHDGGTRVFRHMDRYKHVLKYGRINILDNCVIGQRVIILPGVTIGPNSVVAAGSVVSRSIPPDVLAAGNPAKPMMTLEQYAEWSLATTPEYDPEEYRRDKKAVLLKMHMRGTRRNAARPEVPVTDPDSGGAS